MNKNVASRTKISIAVSVALGAGLMGAGFAPLALAQQAGDVQRVEITGTRLPSLSLEGPSPVTVITAQDIRTDGLAKTEDLLNNMPQVFAAQGSNASNGASGTAQVSLRGLGAARTLVLVNGRRLPAGSPGSYPADLNQVPAALIQRVEMLTGGASAVYGSDAVAGVVNFIMNDKFEGLQLNLNHSFYQHEQGSPVASIVRGRAATNPSQFVLPNDANDGEISDVSVLLGGNFASGRGNATVYFQYKKEDPVTQANRDYSACALAGGAAGFTCGGSSTAFPGRFTRQDTFASQTPTDAAGNIRAYSGALDQYNYAPLNYYRRPSEKYAFNAFAHYDVFKDLRVYTELGFHDDHTVAQIAPSGVFFGSVDLSGTNAIRFENPLLSAAWRGFLGLAAPGDTRDMFIGRRNIEGGGRQDDIRHSSYRVVFGMKGEAFKHWNYDVFMHTGTVLYSESYKNELGKTKIARALNVVTDTRAGSATLGQPVCQSVIDGTDPTCVPYNIWSLGAVTPAALSYMQIPLMQSGSTKQQVMGANFSADLGNYGIKSPAAKNGVSVALGSERRIERLELNTDANFQNFEGAGQGGPTIPIAGKVTVGDMFAEVRAPLIEGRPLFDLLSVNASYRNSKYSTRKKTDSYGLGLEWAPVKDYKLRGSYQRAVRAANIIELFQSQGNNLFDMPSDPCSGAVPTRSFVDCAKTGVTAAQYGTIQDSPAGQFNYLQGGNTNLKPETADSYTLGLVFTPTRNLSGTIDVWQVKVADAVGVAPPTTILQQCLDSGQFCGSVQRDVFGSLWILNNGRIVSINDNLGGFNTSGIDLAVNYDHRLGAYGRLGLHMVGTYLTKWENEPIKNLGKYDCVGLYGSNCGTPTPKWRHKIRATWITPWNLDLALTWRHIDAVLQEGTSGNPLLAGPTFEVERKLKAQNYLDVAAAWTVNKTFTLRAGVNNLSDVEPPLTSVAGPSIFGNGNTFPQVYDALGRLVFLNLTAKF